MSIQLGSLHEEARRVAQFLKTKCPEVKLEDRKQDDKPFAVNKKNGLYTIYISDKLSYTEQLSAVIQGVRIIWAAEDKRCVPMDEDNLIFEAGYRTYMFREMLEPVMLGDPIVEKLSLIHI